MVRINFTAANGTKGSTTISFGHQLHVMSNTASSLPQGNVSQREYRKVRKPMAQYGRIHADRRRQILLTLSGRQKACLSRCRLSPC